MIKFNSYYVEKYIEKLITDFKKNNQIKTIYIGGGQPSLLSNSQTTKLLTAVAQNFISKNLQQYSIETYKEDIKKEKVAIWKKLRINRVVIKAKTITNFNIATKILILQKAKIINYSLDLYYGLKNQKIKDELTIIAKIKPPHISWWSATNEVNYNIIELIETTLISLGYVKYDYVNFVLKPKFISMQTKAINSGKNYIGYGKGAVSLIKNQ